MTNHSANINCVSRSLILRRRSTRCDLWRSMWRTRIDTTRWCSFAFRVIFVILIIILCHSFTELGKYWLIDHWHHHQLHLHLKLKTSMYFQVADDWKYVAMVLDRWYQSDRTWQKCNTALASWLWILYLSLDKKLLRKRCIEKKVKKTNKC